MKKSVLSALLAALMLAQAFPVTVMAAEPVDTNTTTEVVTTSKFSTTERENKNGTKSTVIKIGDKTVEITKGDKYQVVTELDKGKVERFTIVMSGKTDTATMIEIPVDLGKEFKTNWVKATYLNGKAETVFAKYDSDNMTFSFEVKGSCVASIVDDYTLDNSENEKEEVSGNGCTVTKRINKNGSSSTIVVTGKKVVEITTYDDYEVVLTKETGKVPNIKVSVNESIKNQTLMIEAPIDLSIATRAGWVSTTYADDNKQEYISAKYDNSNKILYFEMNESASVDIVDNFPAKKPVVAEKVLPFKDVTKNDWYYEAVEFVYDNQIMVGTSDVTFAPNQTITRAMVVTMLHRLEGKPLTTNKLTFKDVEEDKWYTEAVRWANKAGIVSGYNEDTFGTNDAITREQMLVILYRYAQYKKIDVKLDKNADKMAFNDIDKIGDWAKPAAEWAYANGIVKGANTYLMPQDNATRAQTASMFATVIKTIVKK